MFTNLFSHSRFLTIPFLLRVNFHEQQPWVKSWETTLRRVVLFRLDAIALGALLAYIHTYHKRLWPALCLRGVALFGMSFGVLLMFAIGNVYTHQITFYSTMGNIFMNSIFLILLDLSCVFVVPYFTTEINMGNKLKSFFTRLSMYSYSIYLCHYLLIIVTFKLYHKFMSVSAPSLSMGGMLLILCLSATGIMSYITYHYFELPIMNLRERDFGVENLLRRSFQKTFRRREVVPESSTTP